MLLPCFENEQSPDNFGNKDQFRVLIMINREYRRARKHARRADQSTTVFL
jgi:hypothetical protein